MKLLIVEDHPAMRQFMKSLLEDLVDQTEECEDGVYALEAYRRLRPDWVLMDLQMEQMDGLTASRQILAQFPEARICIVTKHLDTVTRRAAQNAGITAFVSKVNLAELRDVVQDAAGA